jgi:MerR family transcriptional regulator, light-induced transcriptional regulator
MERFSIQDIENITGIKAHTLRVWERRYQFIKSKRKQSNHRYYDGNDLKQLLKISTLYRHGIKLNKINSLTLDEINTLAHNFQASSHTNESSINQLIEATIDFDEGIFKKVLHQCINTNGLTETIINVAYPLMEKVGNLWLTQNIHPVQEHFCTIQIRNTLIAAIDKIESTNTSNEHFLICSPKDEYHEIPLLFIQYSLKKEGHQVSYLGVNSTIENLTVCLSKLTPTHIWIHMITNLSFDYKQHLIRNLKTKYDSILILSGPNAINFTHEENEKVVTLKSMNDILEKVRA